MDQYDISAIRGLKDEISSPLFSGNVFLKSPLNYSDAALGVLKNISPMKHCNKEAIQALHRYKKIVSGLRKSVKEVNRRRQSNNINLILEAVSAVASSPTSIKRKSLELGSVEEAQLKLKSKKESILSKYVNAKKQGGTSILQREIKVATPSTTVNTPSAPLSPYRKARKSMHLEKNSGAMSRITNLLKTPVISKSVTDLMKSVTIVPVTPGDYLLNKSRQTTPQSSSVINDIEEIYGVENIANSPVFKLSNSPKTQSPKVCTPVATTPLALKSVYATPAITPRMMTPKTTPKLVKNVLSGGKINVKPPSQLSSPIVKTPKRQLTPYLKSMTPKSKCVTPLTTAKSRSTVKSSSTASVKPAVTPRNKAVIIATPRSSAVVGSSTVDNDISPRVLSAKKISKLVDRLSTPKRDEPDVPIGMSPSISITPPSRVRTPPKSVAKSSIKKPPVRIPSAFVSRIEQAKKNLFAATQPIHHSEEYTLMRLRKTQESSEDTVKISQEIETLVGGACKTETSFLSEQIDEMLVDWVGDEDNKENICELGNSINVPRYSTEKRKSFNDVLHSCNNLLDEIDSFVVKNDEVIAKNTEKRLSGSPTHKIYEEFVI